MVEKVRGDGCNDGLIYGLVQWQCAMWRTSNAGAVIFVTLAIAVAVMLLA